MTRFLLLIFLTTILFGCKDKIEKQVTYFKSGTLKSESKLVNGKREGVSVDYYENGKVRGTAEWKQGKMHGEKIIYYTNGNKLEECRYSQDRCVYARDYSEDGFLREVTLYDSLGRVWDYFSYRKDGSRDFDRSRKDPIFIPQQDTVNFGYYYSPMIRLGNRQFPIVDVIIGDLSDKKIIKNNKRLPKIDSLTSIMKLKANNYGLNEVSGVVFEYNFEMDSFDIIPFTHRFYVKTP